LKSEEFPRNKVSNAALTGPNPNTISEKATLTATSETAGQSEVAMPTEALAPSQGENVNLKSPEEKVAVIATVTAATAMVTTASDVFMPTETFFKNSQGVNQIISNSQTLVGSETTVSTRSTGEGLSTRGATPTGSTEMKPAGTSTKASALTITTNANVNLSMNSSLETTATVPTTSTQLVNTTVSTTTVIVRITSYKIIFYFPHQLF
jgi:hypothetical protein